MEGYAIGQKVRLLAVPGVHAEHMPYVGAVCRVTSDPWTLPEGWQDTGHYAQFDGVEAYIFQDTDLAPPEQFQGYEVCWPVAFMEPLGDDDERTKESEKDKDIENV